MFDVLPLPVDWPVDVNYHEAKAFCNWKGPSYRLLTEAEHHRIRDDTVSLKRTKYIHCAVCNATFVLYSSH